MITEQFKTGKGDFVLVQVPDNSINHVLTYYTDPKTGLGYYGVHYDFPKESEFYSLMGSRGLMIKDFGGRKKYPKEGSLSIIGIAHDLDEAACTKVVDKMTILGNFFKDYLEFTLWRCSAVGSMGTLLRSLNVWDVNPSGEEPKSLECTCSDCKEDSQRWKDEWEELQGRTGKFLLLRRS